MSAADLHLAFAHPEARAEATAPDMPLDRIALRDYTVDADIGAFQKERGKPQRVRFNIVVEVAQVAQPLEDDVDRILSYDLLTEAIAVELAAERLNLLETLAEKLAARILKAPQAQRVFLRIEKLDLGPGALGVEIVRRAAKSAEPQVVAPTSVGARVAYLSNEALARADLSQIIDQLEDAQMPLILCVGTPPEPAPEAGAALPQRRIALLAIAQNAWRLAARDRRCLVVETRTEFDHASKTGQITVWAPAKIVLDAVDGPEAGPEDPLRLALWFAQMQGAREFVTVGAAPPDRGDMHSWQLELAP